jgi:hypothetical protein
LLPPGVHLDGLQVIFGEAFVHLSASTADELALAMRGFDGSHEFVSVKVLGFTGRATVPQGLSATLHLGASAAAAPPVDVDQAVRALLKHAKDIPVPRPVGDGFEMRWRSRNIFEGRDLVEVMNRTPGFADAQWTPLADGADRQLQLVRFRREATPKGDASSRPSVKGSC